jgi:endo-1,4-beta-mannosidase
LRLLKWLFFVVLLFPAAIHIKSTPPTLPTCSQAEIDAAVAATGSYTPSSLEGYVRVEGQGFKLGDADYVVRGFNYYPAQYPWRRFLTETDEETVRRDFAQFSAMGVNTLRIFVWHQALFFCPGSVNVPNSTGFQKLDMVMRLAAENNLRLIVTLHDMPDLDIYPLYSDTAYHQRERDFIIGRYRDEAAVMAWDVRNEGDIDYGTHYAIPAKFDRVTVLSWLDRTTQQVRALDSNHLITAGWLYDAQSTAPYVDFVSFHHWTGAWELAGRIAPIRAVTDKPILLEEVGYSTLRVRGDEQATLLNEIIITSADAGLAGWLVWTAYDFSVDRSCYPSPCQSPNNGEHYFGMWDVNGDAKPALAIFTDAP